MKKKCPKCGHKAVKLYRNKTLNNKRTWIPTVWYCTTCKYVYQIASNTLIYKVGGEPYHPMYQRKCPKCEKKLVRLYQHKNPAHGKQRWISLGWYCERCKYVWLDNPNTTTENREKTLLVTFS